MSPSAGKIPGKVPEKVSWVFWLSVDSHLPDEGFCRTLARGSAMLPGGPQEA
jgi:hypothetical protein